MTCSEYDYSFDESFCDKCGGKCCTGESGYIWIDETEIRNLAEFFGLSRDEFKKLFLYKEAGKFSIKEKPYNGGFACVFFDEKNKNCGVYDFRPSQCRSFPFWDYFKDKIEELEQECIGVKRL